MTRLIALLLIVEGALGAFWISTLLPRVLGFDPIIDLVIVLRALVSATQVAAGIALRGGRPAGRALARRALFASAMLMTIEIGARLAPSDLTPSLRWPVVGGYWVYAIGAGLWLRSPRRTKRPESSESPRRPLGLD